MKKIIGVLMLLLLLIGGGMALYEAWHEPPPSDELILYGNVDVRQVQIGFRVPGKVAELYFEEGDLVPKSALMAVLDKAPYDHQLAQAEAAIEAIRPQLRNAEILLRRREEAVALGGVTKEETDTALATRDQLRANLLAAEAERAVAADNLAFTEAYAPHEGVLLSRIREPGSVVKAADPVCTLSLLSPVWIRAYVDEPQLGKIAYGMKGKVCTDSGQVYSGTIGFISPVAEFTPKTVETAQLRTDLVYRLRVYVEDPDRLLKQGMPVTLKFHLGKEAHPSE